MLSTLFTACALSLSADGTHGGRNRKDGTNVAGTWMEVTHNSFFCERMALKVRDEPEERVHVAGNCFMHGSQSQAAQGQARTELGANAYGLERPKLVSRR